jgi:hypothetical protein
MLVFHTTDSDDALEILKHGFQDRTDYYGRTQVCTGVWFADGPLTVSDGFDGDTLLALEVPEEVFTSHEWSGYAESYRFALIPATEVNAFGRPQVDSHDFAWGSRRELLRAAQEWEAVGQRHHAAKMRKAIRFFDEVGWQNIAANREEGG